MKKLLLAATFVVAGLTGSLSAKSTITKCNKAFFAEQTRKCYEKRVDPFGNIYYVQVKCPDIIIG